jgi:hypothetical protein
MVDEFMRKRLLSQRKERLGRTPVENDYKKPTYWGDGYTSGNQQP